jgi:hypothetical protein
MATGPIIPVNPEKVGIYIAKAKENVVRGLGTM